jgi:peptidyl-prolyl cis-trans isomerase D
MNKFAKSWISSVFLGVLALSFGVWGIADVFNGGVASDNVVATVGKVEITRQQFQDEYNRVLTQMSQQSPMTPDMARAMGVPQRALQGLIGQVAIANASTRLGVAATDAQVAAFIHSQQAFQNATGDYDYNRFLSVIQNAGYNERDYVEAVRRSILSRQLDIAVESNFKLPLGYARALYDYVGETRAADYVVMSASSIGAIAPPSDAVLEAYLKKNIDRFSTPEYRSFTYAAVTPDAVKGQIQVPDAQVNQEYEARKASYITPERRTIEQIQYPDEAAAKAARAKIAGGQTFSAAATERGLKPTDINLGSLVQADLPGERGKAAFALPEGGVSEPVKDTFGWMIIRVTKIVPGSTKDETVAKNELRDALALAMAGAKIDEMVNSFQDARAAGDDIPTAAKKVGMQTGKITGMDISGKTPEGTPATAPTEPEFLEQVFKSEPGDEGDPFKSATGASYVVKVEGVVPPKPRPLAQVRTEVLAAWTTEERAARLKARADQLVAQAKKENSLAGVASAVGAPIQKSPGLKRTSSDDKLPPLLISQLFSEPVGGITMAENTKSDGYVIARVTAVAHPKQSDTAADFVNLHQQSSAQAASDFPGLLAANEQAGEKISINKKVLDEIIGEGQ